MVEDHEACKDGEITAQRGRIHRRFHTAWKSGSLWWRDAAIARPTVGLAQRAPGEQMPLPLSSSNCLLGSESNRMPEDKGA